MTNNFEHINFASVSESDLLDFVESWHHDFSRSMLKLMIRNFSSALAKSKDHSVMIRDILSLLEQINVKILRLIHQEEESLFPFIRKLIEVKDHSIPIRFLNVKLLESSICKINEEHTHIEALVHSLKLLSHNFCAPDTSDELLKLSFSELKEFSEQYSRNLAREKEVLFPKLLQLESEVMTLSSIAIIGSNKYSNDD
jgi:regulator of cell morphogenesis and NO signaling